MKTKNLEMLSCSFCIPFHSAEVCFHLAVIGRVLSLVGLRVPSTDLPFTRARVNLENESTPMWEARPPPP